MTMITPERTESTAKRLLDPLSNMALSASASEGDDMFEEKKTADADDHVMQYNKQQQKEDGVIANKPTQRMEEMPVWRNMISNIPGSKFLPEMGRYVLYVSRACPDSHSALLALKLKGLDHVVSVKYLRPHPNDHSQRNWVISHEIPDDSLASLKSDEGEFATIRDIYKHENPNCVSNTIPLLYDQEHQCIVNNHANDIIGMFNSSFKDLSKNPRLQLFPYFPLEESKLQELDEWLFPLLQLEPSNVAPYHYNLSRSQLNCAMERATVILSKQRYLLSPTTITAADLRLFTVLIRYDAVYAKYLECPPQLLTNRALRDYCRDIYQQPGVAETVRMDEIRAHFLGEKQQNPDADDVLLEVLQAPHKRHLM